MRPLSDTLRGTFNVDGLARSVLPPGPELYDSMLPSSRARSNMYRLFVPDPTESVDQIIGSHF